MESSDQIFRSEQRREPYYEHIYDGYKKQKSADARLRSQSSIETLLETSLSRCTRFGACFSSARKVKRSSPNQAEEILVGIVFLNKKYVSYPQEDVGSKVKILAAWEALCFLA